MIMSGWWLFQSWFASSVSPSQTIPSCHVHSCGWSVYCVWLWRKWNSVNPPFIFIYFSQAFPATGLWHPSVTQWAELHITLEQQGIKLPQKNKKFNFEKLEKMHLRDKQLRVEFNLKVVERGRDLMITSGKDTLCPSGDNLRSKSMTDRLCWKSFMTLTKTTPSKTNVSLPGNFQWECVFFFVLFFSLETVMSSVFPLAPTVTITLSGGTWYVVNNQPLPDHWHHTLSCLSIPSHGLQSKPPVLISTLQKPFTAEMNTPRRQ